MPSSSSRLELNPDRLLPGDPQQRRIARRLYEAVEDLPVISPHGHVDPRLLAGDVAFRDPATLLLSPDHYVTRLLHADGADLHELGVGCQSLSEFEARRAWRHLCERWEVFAGTPVRFWFEAELVEIFGVTLRPSAQTADAIFDQVAGRLDQDAYKPRALYDRFKIEVLTTTFDPCDDLSAYESLLDDPSWTGRTIPAFRPDRYLELDRPDWPKLVDRLGETAGLDTGDYQGFLAALRERRRFFIDHGATSADHSHLDARTDPLEPAEAERIYRAALTDGVNGDEATAFRRHMMMEMARMSCEDGLVMTLHPGIRRNHHRPTQAVFGPDAGCDIPVRVEFTEALRPLLERYGTSAGFHLVVFTVDETAWSRELAPLAGFYPSVYVGAPWWFLDAPDAIRRFRSAVTETVGFSRTSGFVDDTRAFCSIPARHDMARRVDAGVLAGYVTEHRLSEDEAAEIAVDMVTMQPRRVFKL